MAKKEQKTEKAEKKGKGLFSLMCEIPQVKRFTTGFVGIDLALGGGLARGSIIEIYGEESEGKTTLGLSFMNAALKQGFSAIYLELEHCIDISYIARLIDINRCHYDQPLSIEETFDAIHKFMGGYKGDKIILVDSVAAMDTDKAIESSEDPEAKKEQNAAVAAFLSGPSGIKSIIRDPEYGNTTVIFINQTRDNMNMKNAFGPRKHTTGGNALKFYAGHRLNVHPTKDGKIKRGSTVVGKRVGIKVVKNKFGAPERTCEVNSYFGTGYSKESSLFFTAKDMKLIKPDNGELVVVDSGECFSNQEKLIAFLESAEGATLWESLDGRCRAIGLTDSSLSEPEEAEG